MGGHGGRGRAGQWPGQRKRRRPAGHDARPRWRRPVELLVRIPLLLAAAACSLLSPEPEPEPHPGIGDVTFEQVYPLGPGEGVFAYSRISPDGNFLAYASETPGSAQRTVTVVDLRTREILFEEPGIDPYFSPDGERIIYLSRAGGSNVTIRHHQSGELVRSVAPTSLGDYYSWGVRDGRHLILTIESNYYFLEGDEAELPAGRVESCPGIGRGDRPLLSREGDRITTFVRGTVVVRDLMGCDFVLDTGIQGAKADFAWGGRYVAFHAPKASGGGYHIKVVDIQERTVRTITDFEGSSYFPSWTEDGRISFRYDGPDYRGFMTASGVLTAPEQPLPSPGQQIAAVRFWEDVFPETERPGTGMALVLVWGPWSAHSPEALADLDRIRADAAGRGLDLTVLHATDPGSFPGDAERLLEREGIDTPRIPLAAERRSLTEAHNQNPTTLLFEDGRLIDRRMGAQTFGELVAWVEGAVGP